MSRQQINIQKNNVEYSITGEPEQGGTFTFKARLWDKKHDNWITAQYVVVDETVVFMLIDQLLDTVGEIIDDETT